MTKKATLQCRYCRCKTILFKYQCASFFFFLVFLLPHYVVNCIFVALFLCLLFFPLSLASLFSRFTQYARAHSGIPHCRNNYYYESDPGQETTIVSSFLLLVLPIPSSSTTHPPPLPIPHRIHGACFILASYRIISGRWTGHSVVYTEW